MGKIMKNKITIGLLLLASAPIVDAATYQFRSPAEVKLSQWQPMPPTYSQWTDVGEPTECTGWLPAPDDVDFGTTFLQSQSCLQSMTRIRYQQEKDVLSGQYRDLNEVIENEVYHKESTQEATGTKKTRDMCFDKLQRGEATTNGTYSVDPDGHGPLPARQAYCLMSEGGWTLYDSFGTYTGETGESSPAYNAKGINSRGGLQNAGYTTYLTSINNGTYHVTDQYMQFFYGGIPHGYIKKNMPSWVNTVRVDASNQWRGWDDYIKFGSSTKQLNAWQHHTEFTIHGSGELKIWETSIIWLDAVWVK